MGSVTILKDTTKNPLQMIGQMAGICWESPVEDPAKNIKRAVDCIVSGHGRTMEYPDVYMVLSGYSARVIREWYTHIGGSPTRLQSSTRYVNADNFQFVTPPQIKNNSEALELYNSAMENIRSVYGQLLEKGIAKEDAAMLLPLGMETKIVDKRNFRNLADMSRQRMCNRAYHEYRVLFNDIKNALKEYSPEWAWLVDNCLYAKCEKDHLCPESKSCGKYPKAPKTELDLSKLI